MISWLLFIDGYCLLRMMSSGVVKVQGKVFFHFLEQVESYFLFKFDAIVLFEMVLSEGLLTLYMFFACKKT